MFVTTLNAEKLWQSLKNWAKFDLQITSKSSKFIFICLSECLKQHFEAWHLAAFSFRFYLLWQGRQADTCSQQKYYICAYCQGLIQLFEASRSRQTFPAGPSSNWRFFAGWHHVAMTTDPLLPYPPPPTLPVLWLPLRTQASLRLHLQQRLKFKGPGEVKGETVFPPCNTR